MVQTAQSTAILLLAAGVGTVLSLIVAYEAGKRQSVAKHLSSIGVQCSIKQKTQPKEGEPPKQTTQEKRANKKLFKEEQRRTSAKAKKAQDAAKKSRKAQEVAVVQDGMQEDSEGLEFWDPAQEEIFNQSRSGQLPPRLLRAETVLSHRTHRFLLVLESAVDSRNQQAVLRTAESFGMQDIWIVRSPVTRDEQGQRVRGDEETSAEVSDKKRFCSGASLWLTVRFFDDTISCIAALREEGYTIWATDLSPVAECISRIPSSAVPAKKLAVVMGREVDGVSETMLEAADKRIYLDMFGFTESFNLSVASALMLHCLFDKCPVSV
jgi:tRNA G18 (ribose-2'-O)-methylase SpoU